MRSPGAGTSRAWANSITGTTSGFGRMTRPNRREGAGGVVGSHVLQNVRCGLKGLLTNLVHADRLPAVVACHQSATCDGSSRGVHPLSLRFIGGWCHLRTAAS